LRGIVNFICIESTRGCSRRDQYPVVSLLYHKRKRRSLILKRGKGAISGLMRRSELCERGGSEVHPIQAGSPDLLAIRGSKIFKLLVPQDGHFSESPIDRLPIKSLGLRKTPPTLSHAAATYSQVGQLIRMGCSPLAPWADDIQIPDRPRDSHRLVLMGQWRHRQLPQLIASANPSIGRQGRTAEAEKAWIRRRTR
jgi:hypothetical protein